MTKTAQQLAEQLKTALATEVESARAQRQLLRSLQAEAILNSSAQREAFNARATRLQYDLSKALDSTRERPLELEQTLEEIRSLAMALHELDVFNRTIGNRTLTVVRSYLTAIVPRPAAYDRQGRRARTPHETSHSTRI